MTADMQVPVVGFEGLYDVTDCGHIIRLSDNKDIHISRIGKGYCGVSLRNGRVSHSKYVHRIVLEAFRGMDTDNPECNHINGIKTDNSLENLEWSNRSHNMKHAFRTGLNPRPDNNGEKNANVKLTAEQVCEIVRLYKAGGYYHSHLAKKYSVSRSCIGEILRGASWVKMLSKEGLSV